MGREPAQLRHLTRQRILAEIADLARDLRSRREDGRRPAASVVRAYQAAIDRHYARLDALVDAPQ